MGNVDRQEVTIDGVNWEYFVAGQGRTFYLIPAFHSDITRLAPIVDYLSRYFRVVMPHLPGISNSQSLGHYRYNCKNYARFLNRLVEKLKLTDYILGGICLGGMIIVRMLQQGLVGARHVVIIEGIYDADYIHLEEPYDSILRLAMRLGSRNALIKRTVDLVLHNEKMLRAYMWFNYRHEPNLTEVINHQVNITKIMATRAYIEVAMDIFNTHMSQELLAFNVPTILIYNRADNILDLPLTINGMQRIFPNSEVFKINLSRHSPAGAIDTSTVEAMIAPVKAKLKELR